MTTTIAAVLAIGVTLCSVAASARDAQPADGAVSGLGPGGSGAGQSSLGPSKAFLGRSHRSHRHVTRHVVR